MTTDDIKMTGLTREAPLVSGGKAARGSSVAEESHTLTVSVFSSTKRFFTSEEASLEGQVSHEVIALDTNSNILYLLLATYDSTSTVIAVSTTTASNTKSLLVTNLKADGFNKSLVKPLVKSPSPSLLPPSSVSSPPSLLSSKGACRQHLMGRCTGGVLLLEFGIGFT